MEDILAILATYQSFQIYDYLMKSLDLEDAYSRSQAVCKPLQVTRKKKDFKWTLNNHKLLNKLKRWLFMLGLVRPGQDVKNVLYASARRNGLPRCPGKKFLEDGSWGSGVDFTENLKLAAPWLKKRSWQPVKGFKLPQKWFALKHSSSWHPSYQCWDDCSKGKCPPHIMPLIWCAVSRRLWSHSKPG